MDRIKTGSMQKEMCAIDSFEMEHVNKERKCFPKKNIQMATNNIRK